MRLVYASIVLAVSAFHLSRLFRLPHDTMLKAGLGDWVDPYFINFLLEHEHRCGKRQPFSRRGKQAIQAAQEAALADVMPRREVVGLQGR